MFGIANTPLGVTRIAPHCARVALATAAVAAGGGIYIHIKTGATYNRVTASDTASRQISL
jgi:hypothetical protein